MRINEFLQRYFLKKRIVYTVGEAQPKEHEDYSILRITPELAEIHKEFLKLHIPEEKLSGRLKNPDVSGFLAVNKWSGEPAGFEWTIYSTETEYIHDKFIIPKGFGFLFNAYVAEDHRKRGLFRVIKSQAANYLISEKRCSHVLSVVESLNHSSVKGNQRLGSLPYGTNYLCKVAGRNLLSVSRIPGLPVRTMIVPVNGNNKKM